MRLAALVLAGGIVLVTATPGYAWGNDGHRIVCEIAHKRLTPAGKALLDEAMALRTSVEDPFKICDSCAQQHPADGRAMSFPTSCIWADEARTDTHKDTYEYHFINVPKAETAFSVNRDCRAMDCAIVGIQRFARYLAEPAGQGRSRERKALALRFLGHYVGDLHQPLHVGHAEDLGGNNLKVNWRPGSGQALNSNLHKVRDGQVLERAGLTAAGTSATLNGEISSGEVAQWETFDLVKWASESYDIAQEKAYRHPDGSLVEMNDTLGKPYFDEAHPVVRQQLKMAGVRLAFLINSAAAGTAPPSRTRGFHHMPQDASHTRLRLIRIPGSVERTDTPMSSPDDPRTKSSLGGNS